MIAINRASNSLCPGHCVWYTIYRTHDFHPQYTCTRTSTSTCNCQFGLDVEAWFYFAVLAGGLKSNPIEP